MIIGLSGYKGSGKDTVAAYLVKMYSFERRAFADPLKKSVAALFDIPFSEVDKLKNDPTAEVVLTFVRESFDRKTPDRYIYCNFREFLQRYGTEAHRDVPEMGEDFWVDLTLPHKGYYTNRKLVVSDVRYENEARRIRYLGGVVVEVDRGIVNQDPHRSEVLPVADHVIFNKGTINDLYLSAEAVLNQIV